jgi:hypothetical protein
MHVTRVVCEMARDSLGVLDGAVESCGWSFATNQDLPPLAVRVIQLQHAREG